jgi:hypothetical protein
MARSRPYRANHGSVVRDIVPGNGIARSLEPILDM